MDDQHTAAFVQLRPLLFSIAYRMTGSAADAEDVVSESFLRYQRALAAGTEPASVRAYLSAVATRLSIDQLRSARARRERYIGPWLPEPLLTGPGRPGSQDPICSASVPWAGAGAIDHGIDADPAGAAERSETLSMAFLLTLERLSPLERAVFLLHDVFSYGYADVATIIERSESYCRQLARRARTHLADERPRHQISREQRARLAGAFFRALSGTDLGGLAEALAADVVVYGDGGGAKPSWPRPIRGQARVIRLMSGLADQVRRLGLIVEPAEVNGEAGAVVRDPSGGVVSVFALELAGDRICAVRSVINPAKLGHLGPLADRDALRAV